MTGPSRGADYGDRVMLGLRAFGEMGERFTGSADRDQAFLSTLGREERNTTAIFEDIRQPTQLLGRSGAAGVVSLFSDCFSRLYETIFDPGEVQHLIEERRVSGRCKRDWDPSIMQDLMDEVSIEARTAGTSLR